MKGFSAIASELIKCKANVNSLNKVSRGDKLTGRCEHVFVDGWSKVVWRQQGSQGRDNPRHDSVG